MTMIRNIETAATSARDTLYTNIIAKGGTASATDTIKTLAEEVANLFSATGKYLVQVIDYDGTVLVQSYGIAGTTVSLPSAPSHTGLVFDGWSSPVTITSNTVTIGNSDITIGATYHTSSGNTEIDITITTITGLTVTLQNLTGMTAINWGDGTTDALSSHTYSRVGNYTIAISGVTGLGADIFAQSDSAYNYYCTAVRLNSGVTSIGGDAFIFCSSLTSITIPNSITSIGGDAFGGCYSLTSITLPDSVTSIGEDAFEYCSSLTSITLPSGVPSIDTFAFYNCNSLTSITLPSGVTSIGNSAFYNCNSLTSITLPSGVTSIGNNAFSSCYSLTSITIPSGVTSIGTQAFYNCSSLTSITIPSGVTSIGTYAFSSCYSLTSITIPDSVTSIGDNAFSSCYRLTSITLPSGVTSIRTYAFYNCLSIVEYDFTALTAMPTFADTNIFTGINGICKIRFNATLYPTAILAANLSTYQNYIAGVVTATGSYPVDLTSAASLVVQYQNSTSASITITWGDGSTADTVAVGDYITHTYASATSYTITVA